MPILHILQKKAVAQEGRRAWGGAGGVPWKRSRPSPEGRGCSDLFLRPIPREIVGTVDGRGSEQTLPWLPYRPTDAEIWARRSHGAQAAQRAERESDGLDQHWPRRLQVPLCRPSRRPTDSAHKRRPLSIRDDRLHALGKHLKHCRRFPQESILFNTPAFLQAGFQSHLLRRP